MRHLDCACARIDLLDVRVPPWLSAGFLAGVLQGIGAFATESVQWRCTALVCRQQRLHSHRWRRTVL